MQYRRNNFGTWLNFKLHTINRTKTWLENRSKLSTGSICRWIKGSTPGIDNYFSVCSTLAKEMKVDVSDVVKETLEYMPYLVSYKVEPKSCPTCGQKNPT
tara:strand:+ start:505 stop:804 length:300 start_codon:yes stop_codon:yes gene_type:complete